MTITIKNRMMWIVLSGLVLCSLAQFTTHIFAQTASSQKGADSVGAPARAEFDFNYSALHSNVLPDGCGCFFMNGGNAQIEVPVMKKFSMIGEFGLESQTISSSNGAQASLTLQTYSVGARYRPALRHGVWSPFAETLAGVSHATGSAVSGLNAGAKNASASFLFTAGGGVDLRINSHVALRVAEIDYMLTTVDNGSNNHQNNLRLGAGFILRWSR